MYVVSLLKRFIFCFIVIIMPRIISADTIYIAPFSGTNPKTLFYDENSSRDECALPFCRLREAIENEGHQIKFITGNEKLNKRAIIISFNNVGLLV